MTSPASSKSANCTLIYLIGTSNTIPTKSFSVSPNLEVMLRNGGNWEAGSWERMLMENSYIPLMEISKQRSDGDSGRTRMHR